MPPEQLALAPGELVALESRSNDDLPDDADGGLAWANLLMVGDAGCWEGMEGQKGWGCCLYAGG